MQEVLRKIELIKQAIEKKNKQIQSLQTVNKSLEEKTSLLDSRLKEFSSAFKKKEDTAQLDAILDKFLSKTDNHIEAFEDKDAKINELCSQLDKLMSKLDALENEKSSWKSKYYALMAKSIKYLSIHRKKHALTERRRQESLKKYRKIREEPASNVSYTHEYRFGRTTEKVKERFVDFIREMYEDAVFADGVYYLSKDTSASNDDEETIIRRLLPIEYKNTGHKVLEINDKNEWTSILDEDAFIDYVTHVKD